jgi:rod shape-determining protein MreC
MIKSGFYRILFYAVISILILAIAFSIFWIKLKFSLANFLSGNENNSSINVLEAENLNLKSQLINMNNLKNYESVLGKAIPDFVFSSYPFNFKNLLYLSPLDGIKIGSPVVFNNDLIGVVNQTSSSYIEVKTIFDPSWQSSVYIGSSSISALLSGGIIPKLTLIDKNAQINNGDVVFNADKNFPYGLVLGKVSNIRLSSGGVFYEADLDPIFDFNSLKVVGIING